MDTNKILQADLLDIIFDDRNKSYGAYELRRTYSKRIVIALSGTLITVAAIAGITAMTGKEKMNKINFIVKDYELTKVDEKNHEKIQPPPPKPKVEPVAVKTIKVTPPVVVHDNEVTEKDKPPVIVDLENVKIAAVTNPDGVGGDIMTPPLEKSTGGAGIKVTEEIDNKGIVDIVQIQARYPGGPDAWKKFLERNLRRDVPMENGASTGRYTVVVSFIVDKEGNTSEVKAETDPGYGTATEAIRVIKSSGKWQPAEQNGHTVIYRQKQVITFVIDN
jgi:protein TonB